MGSLALSPLVDLWYTLGHLITLLPTEDLHHATDDWPCQTEDLGTRHALSESLPAPGSPALAGACSPAAPGGPPAHDTLLPAPPEASYSLPAPDELEDIPRVEASPVVSSSVLLEELMALWPELQAVARWWQERQILAQQDHAPDRKLTRQTYHVEQRYIDAVKQEADRTGESHAAVVNRAFARYFGDR
jgi:hypothetical protein